MYFASPGGFSLNTPEEKAASNLAAELLLPHFPVAKHAKAPPVDARTLQKIAKAAGVSVVMAACRVASLAPQLGLVNAAVLGFSNGVLKWTWSKTLRVPPEAATNLLRKTREAAPCPFRGSQSDGSILVASRLESPTFMVIFISTAPACSW